MSSSSCMQSRSSKRLKILKDEPHSNSDSDDNLLAETVTNSTVCLAGTLPCNGSRRWTTSAIYTLISAFKFISKQEIDYVDVAELWSDISEILCKRKFLYTPEQCRTKWSLLKKLYYQVATEEHIQKFEFFKYLHEILDEPRIDKIFKTYQRSKSKKPKRILTLSLKQAEIKQEQNAVHEREDVEEETYIEVEFLNGSPYEQEEKIAYVEQTDANLEFDGGNGDYDMPTYLAEISEEQPKEEVESYDHSALLQGRLSADDLPAYLQQFKEVVELQEQRRDERHREKLKFIQEQSDRLLTQYKNAIFMHQKLMEQLIDSL